MARNLEPQIELGRAVRAARAERDLTQDELGVRAGIHPTWISHIESGRINPTWGNVRRIAAGLGMPTSDLARKAEQIEVLMVESGESKSLG